MLEINLPLYTQFVCPSFLLLISVLLSDALERKHTEILITYTGTTWSSYNFSLSDQWSL